MAVTDFVSNLQPFGGFAPFPNSIMVPFMGYQSAVLGYQFGLNYEIGKRTVKAMNNDLFNKIVQGDDTPINVTYNGSEYHLTYAEYIDFITKQHANENLLRFKSELPKAQELMRDIIEQSVAIELKKAERTPSAYAEILNALGVSTNSEIVQWLDSLSDTERAFIIQNVPLIGLLYTAEKSGIWHQDPPPEEPPTEPPSTCYQESDILDTPVWTYKNDTSTWTYESRTGAYAHHLNNLKELQAQINNAIQHGLHANHQRYFHCVYTEWLAAHYCSAVGNVSGYCDTYPPNQA